MGAGGESLDVKGVTSLQVTIEGTNITQFLPCYILESSKPIWKGELQNCGLILGTNAMEEWGYSIVNNKGQTVISSKNTESAVVRGVILSHVLRLGPQQTRIARVTPGATS